MPNTQAVPTVFLALGICLIVIFGFLSGKNPVAFGQATTTTSSISISVEVPPTSTPDGFPTIGDGGTTVTLPARGNATVIFSGFSYPDAVITLFRNGSLAGNTVGQKDGAFEKMILADSGISAFSVSARDTALLTSLTQNFSLNILPGSTVRIEKLLLSPTITTKDVSIPHGTVALFHGSAYPKGVVQIIVDDMLTDTVLPQANGAWQYNLVTKPLARGTHAIFARSFIPSSGLFSPPSDVMRVAFTSSKCNGSDLNNDGVVNVADFSILLFYWKQTLPKNQCADLSGDTRVDVADLSILMYAWRK